MKLAEHLTAEVSWENNISCMVDHADRRLPEETLLCCARVLLSYLGWKLLF